MTSLVTSYGAAFPQTRRDRQQVFCAAKAKAGGGCTLLMSA